MKPNLFFFYIFSLSLLTITCTKKTGTTLDKQQALINAAQLYFNQKINSGNNAFDTASFRARQSKTILWDQASVESLSVGLAVVVPIQYEKKLYLKIPTCGNKLLDLSGLTKLVLFVDSNTKFRYQVNTLIPDSNAIVRPNLFSGVILTEDWFGNSLLKPSVLTSPKSSTKIVDELAVIQTCTTIDGYNYSPDDPEDGYAWTETSCTTYAVVIEDAGTGLGGGDGAAVSGGGSSGVGTFAIPPPTNRIANFNDYIKCFTNVGGTDHTYTITLAIEQPKPGTRTPWVSTNPASNQNGNPVNVGHTWLIMTEKTAYGTTTRNVGFYPQGIVNPQYPSDQGALNDDELTPYNISLTITVTNSQFFTILNFLSQGNNPGFLYNLNSNNCTNFTLNALANGGIDISTTKGTWPGGSGDDPGDLGEDVLSMRLPANMTLNTVGNAHPNIGSCL